MDLHQQLTAKLDELQRPLRLPKEHETGKHVIYIITLLSKTAPEHSTNE